MPLTKGRNTQQLDSERDEGIDFEPINVIAQKVIALKLHDSKIGKFRPNHGHPRFFYLKL
jgi:hypothetical protein